MRKSLKDLLIQTNYKAPQGKGELRKIKFDDMGVMVHDEEQATEEQAKIERERLKAALKVMGKLNK